MIAYRAMDNSIDGIVVDLARRRLAELQVEQEKLVAFLQRAEGRREVRQVASAKEVAPTTRRSRRTPKTAAERKAISARMKKYWAEKRKG